jgi:hypothetical protein
MGRTLYEVFRIREVRDHRTGGTVVALNPQLLLTAYSGSIQPEDAREIPFLGFRDGGTCDVVGRLSRQRNARASPWFATARRADTDSRR